jgi:hypothetical protein
MDPGEHRLHPYDPDLAPGGLVPRLFDLIQAGIILP